MNEQDLHELSQMENSSNSVCLEIEDAIKNIIKYCKNISEMLKEIYPELSKLWNTFADNLSKPNTKISSTFSTMSTLLKTYIVEERERTSCKEELAAINSCLKLFEQATSQFIEIDVNAIKDESINDDSPLIKPEQSNEETNSNSELIKRIKRNLKKSKIIEKGNGSIISELQKIKREKNIA